MAVRTVDKNTDHVQSLSGEKVLTEEAKKELFKRALSAQLNLLSEEEEKAKNELVNSGAVKQDQDHVALSDTSRSPGVKDEQTTENRYLDVFLPEWEMLADWKPSADMGLSDMLESLMILYRKLASFAEADGQLWEQLQPALDKALASAIEKFWKLQGDNISEFFGSFGDKETGTLLRASVYHEITGRFLSEKEAKTLWPASESVGKMPDGRGLPSGSWPAKERGGIIYSPEGRGKAVVSRNYSTNFQKEPTSGEKKAAATYGGAPGDLPESGSIMKRSSYRPGGLYSAADMEKTEQFVNYLRGDGKLSEGKRVYGSHEEALGLSAAVIYIKAQEYAKAVSMGPGMKAAVLSAMDRFIDYCLGCRETEWACANDRTAAPEKRMAMDRKSAYRIFYFTTGEYRSGGKALQAIWKGIALAFEVFTGKKREEASRGPESFKDQFLFFQTQQDAGQRAGNTGRKTEVEKMKEFFEQDWKKFERLLDQGQQFSLWGAALTGNGGNARTWGRGVLWVFVAAICLISAYLVFKSFAL